MRRIDTRRRTIAETGPPQPVDPASGSLTAELVELGVIAPPRGRGPGSRAVFGAALATLVALVLLAGGPKSVAPTVEATTNPGASAAPVSGPPPTVNPWAWAELELRGFGRGASVENLWVLGNRFVAEIETDDGPDGGPYGPVSSVLLTSSDGLAWSGDEIDLPADGFVVAAGAVADQRLWVLGYTGATDAPRWQFWSTEDGTWRHEADPIGLVDGPARVTDLAYHRCEADTDCPAAGWVAVVALTNSSGSDEVWTSSGGRSWRPVELAGHARLTVIGLTVHRGRWIAAATTEESGKPLTVVLTSADRVTWSKHAVTASQTGGRDITAGVAGLALVGTEEVQGSRLPRVWLSADGTSWLRLAGETPFGRAPAPMDHVTATAHGYLAMSTTSGDAWISTDGEQWRARQAFDGGAGSAVHVLAAAGDTLVAAGRSGAGRPTFWSAGLSALLGLP